MTSDPSALSGANHWTAAQLRFQGWLATPPGQRQPQSQRAIAHELGVHPTTLSDWKRLEGWGAAVYAIALAELENDLVPILQAQARHAKLGSLPHAQWLFDLAGKWTPRARMEHSGTVRHEHTDLTKLNDTELADLERLLASARPDSDARRN
jgi:hypothetical protein